MAYLLLALVVLLPAAMVCTALAYSMLAWCVRVVSTLVYAMGTRVDT
jgi:hypothetical protein